MVAIFLSYRRDDSAGHAGRLFDRLQDHFGKDNVFWDVSGSIKPGEPFDEAIEHAIEQCDVLIAMIGRRWLDSTDDLGQRRLDNPQDYLRLEIETALRREIRVVPVLVHGAELPSASDLPEGLKPLARHQAVQLSDGGWDGDVDRFLKGLGSSGRGWRRRMVLIGGVAAVAGVAGIAGIVATDSGSSSSGSTAPRAPKITASSKFVTWGEGVRQMTLAAGERRKLQALDLYAVRPTFPRPPSSCDQVSRGFVWYTWQVRKPYPNGDLEVVHNDPMHFNKRGSVSKRAEAIELCKAHEFINQGLEPMQVEIRYVSVTRK